MCNINSLETQYVTRCNYCGDSSDPAHGHFSIHIDINNDTPMMYRCLKCDASGLITDTVLEEAGVYLSSDMQSELKSFNRKAAKKMNLVNVDMEHFNVPVYNDSLINSRKLDYLNRRLGTNIDYIEAQDMKVILNLYDFIKLNDMPTIAALKMSHIKFLNDNYIGFLSTNNNCITFRNITENKSYMRYFKTLINPTNINPDTFYSLPNSIDLLYTKDINVHISEGIMDILSVYKNVVNKKDNNFYYASCGFGYLTILKYLIHHGLNSGLNIHIYSDNDKKDYDHFKYLFHRSSISYWMDHIWIHRNTYENEKDYGVPLKNIIDSHYIIK